jgi:DnaA N-terminal domain
MEPTNTNSLPTVQAPGYMQAWEYILGQLQGEMSRASFETWVKPLQPLGYEGQVYRVGAYNPYALEWVQNRLKNRIGHLLEAMYNQPVKVQFSMVNSFKPERTKISKTTPVITENESEPITRQGVEAPVVSNRKMMLQRAYGSERAKLIQPERGMFVTTYFFCEWLPLLGHSAFATILASRSLCYWNPMTGELRNTIETAAVSVRTIKDVLTNELVRQYFLRYLVRRVMTPNGVRTAGISLQVRMDDPLTPQDQQLSEIPESENWYSSEFDNETEEDS